MRKIFVFVLSLFVVIAAASSYDVRKGKEVIFDNVKSVSAINVSQTFHGVTDDSKPSYAYWEILLEDGTVYTTFDGDFFTDAPVYYTNAPMKKASNSFYKKK